MREKNFRCWFYLDLVQSGQRGCRPLPSDLVLYFPSFFNFCTLSHRGFSNCCCFQFQQMGDIENKPMSGVRYSIFQPFEVFWNFKTKTFWSSLKCWSGALLNLNWLKSNDPFLSLMSPSWFLFWFDPDDVWLFYIGTGFSYPTTICNGILARMKKLKFLLEFQYISALHFLTPWCIQKCV